MIKNYNEFSNYEKVNEEIFSSIGKLFGNLFKRIKNNINKTKGGKEIEVIYQKYLNLIQKELQDKAGIDLNVVAASQLKESILVREFNDAPSTSTGVSSSNLKKKSAIMDQIVNKYKEMALKEMNAVLSKYGGDKNPKLAIIVNAKKDQFELDFLNAKMKYLELSGDKNLINLTKKSRDLVSKKIQEEWKKFDSNSSSDYNVGDTVKYKMNNGEESQNQITKIEGDDVYFNGENGEFKKQKNDIIGKVGSDENESDNAKEAAESLGKIKSDSKKMSSVKKFADFLLKNNDSEKLSEIDKIISTNL